MTEYKGYLGVKVDVNGPMLVLTEAMSQARDDLIDLLRQQPRNYEDQVRKLSEYQAHMRAVDILAGNVDVNGNALGQTTHLIVTDKTITEAAKVISNGNGPRDGGGLAAVADALANDLSGEHEIEENHGKQEDTRLPRNVHREKKTATG